mgnify:CR=1 FL=1
MLQPCRGDIWYIDLNPTRGREQSGKRPGLIISENSFNFGPAGLVVVLPITSKYKGIPLHVPIKPEASQLPQKSYTKCEDIRSISKERLISKVGSIDNFVLSLVEDNLKILLGIF